MGLSLSCYHPTESALIYLHPGVLPLKIQFLGRESISKTETRWGGSTSLLWLTVPPILHCTEQFQLLKEVCRFVTKKRAHGQGGGEKQEITTMSSMNPRDFNISVYLNRT